MHRPRTDAINGSTRSRTPFRTHTKVPSLRRCRIHNVDSFYRRNISNHYVGCGGGVCGAGGSFSASFGFDIEGWPCFMSGNDGGSSSGLGGG